MLERLPTTWLRPALTILGLAGLLALSACGGGSGAPNNPYVAPPTTPALSVQPSTVTAYSGVPVTVTVTSGVAPFYAFSGNSTVLPVVQNVAGNTIVLLPSKVTADTPVTITVQDSAGQTAQVTVNVVASSILNTLTFAPSGTDCKTNLCSGQTGTATVIAVGPGGAPLVARPIRFDVVYGPFAIATSNPAAPLVQTLTIATDSTGTAVASIQANVNATTQPAQIRATDVTSGQQQIANFTVVNNTVAGGSPLTVIPGTATITGPDKTTCSSGFRTDYYIYGGNPPYTVSSTFPGGIVLVNSTVSVSGGFFETITNGTCVNPLTFTIVDSAGKQTTALLINAVGTTPPPTPVPLVISPETQSGACSATFAVTVTGGQPSYNVTATPTGPTIKFNATNKNWEISGITASPTTITVTDQSSPQQAKTATITCS
jgi:hypothetical protein